MVIEVIGEDSAMEEGDRGGRYGGRGREHANMFQYAQTDEIVPGSDGHTKARITYFKSYTHVNFVDFCHDLVEADQMHQDAIVINIEEKEKNIEEDMSGTTRKDFKTCKSTGDHDTWAEINIESDNDESLVTSLKFVSVIPPTPNGYYNDTDILIGNGSTTSVSNNPKMLLDI